MNDNKVKSINGVMVKHYLLTTLQKCQDNGTIVYCTKDYRCGYPSCSEKQFYAPFYIEFQDGNAWILYATNSIRNDRMCIQQWHSEHIKVLFPNVIKSIVVVPSEVRDVQKESREVLRYNEKIEDKSFLSFVDQVVYQDELEEMIVGYANQIK